MKYVGLLAFTKIVSTHAHLVALHQDVILDCIDDPDITIRLRALELVVSMVSGENLQAVVARLMRQLRSPSPDDAAAVFEESEEYYPSGDDTYTGRPGDKKAQRKANALALPESYKMGVIKRILEMCSREMYANVTDFQWYLDVLVQLVRFAPPVSSAAAAGEYYDGAVGGDDDEEDEEDESTVKRKDVGEDIGFELRNVAVRVKSVRAEAVGMADLLVRRREGMFPAAGGGGRRVLYYTGWIVGEFASLLPDPESTLSALISPVSSLLPADILAIYIQAIPKLYATVTGNPSLLWTPHRKSSVSLLTDSIVRFLEPHATSPDIEVQERSVEFLELLRLAVEAVASQPAGIDTEDAFFEPPRILTQAIPELFIGMELNPVAPRAQRKVPVPPSLDLDEPVNPYLHALITQANLFSLKTTNLGDVTSDTDESGGDEEIEFHRYYYTRYPSPSKQQNQLLPASAAIDSAASRGGGPGSYQYQTADDYLDPDILARRKAERRERNRDDPFYISGGPGEYSPSRTPNPLTGEEVDVDSIPIMPLDLNPSDLPMESSTSGMRKVGPVRVEIVKDEEVDGDEPGLDSPDEEKDKGRKGKKGKKKGGIHPLLGSGGGGLVGFSLEDEEGINTGKKGKEEEVRKARAEVDRLRREIEERERAEREEQERKSKEEEERKKLRMRKKNTRMEKGKGKGKEKDGEMETQGESAGRVKVRKRVKKANVGGEGEGDLVRGTVSMKRRARKAGGGGGGGSVPPPIPSSSITETPKKKKKKEEGMVKGKEEESLIV